MRIKYSVLIHQIHIKDIEDKNFEKLIYSRFRDNIIALLRLSFGFFILILFVNSIKYISRPSLVHKHSNRNETYRVYKVDMLFICLSAAMNWVNLHKTTSMKHYWS